ncbi:MAG: hypothetical protein LPK58_00250 [Gammaproteobacteria bacterium]|nr:hypothetical protein [Gammaproteobacteria bacterium]MDX5374207.1 hypothetical protein [Gammaproteobacteria bacterium]
MPFDEQRVAESFAFDPAQIDTLRSGWRDLLDLAVWGDLKTQKIGAVPRLRKRLLELGENLRSVINDRRWIPQERERIKGAMGAMLNLRDALLQLERAAQVIDGGEDFTRFETDLLGYRQQLLVFIEKHERLWGDLLESLYDEPLDDDDDD